MIRLFIISLFTLCGSNLAIHAQDININDNSQSIGIDWEDLYEELFEESDLVEDSKFIWADYHLFSNLKEMAKDVQLIVPPVGLNIEGQLYHNATWRFSVGSQWWEKDIVLVRSFDEDFSERFKFQYWTAGLGGAWHFNVGDRIDPYVGYLFSYRHLRAACDCIAENRSTTTHDFFAGARFFLGTGFFVSAEVGRNGTGFFNGGLGVRF